MAISAKREGTTPLGLMDWCVFSQGNPASDARQSRASGHNPFGISLSISLKMHALVFDDLRDLTPRPLSLSPLRGEGAAVGHRYYSLGSRHCYDGVLRTARRTKFGSSAMSRSAEKT